MSPIAIPVINRRKNIDGMFSGTGEEGSQKSTVKAQADIINSPTSKASMLYSGQRSIKVRTTTGEVSVEEYPVLPGMAALTELRVASLMKDERIIRIYLSARWSWFRKIGYESAISIWAIGDR